MERNVAVVGCGYWGKNLARNFADLDALHTICDRDPKKLETLRDLYPGIVTQTSVSEVLKEDAITGLVISSPAALHYSLTKEALLANKDVLVEKPLAMRVEEGRELVELAGEKRRILMVGHLLEYHPGIAKLKELVNQGELGKINYIYSNRLNLGKFRTEENILWSFAPHDISVILLLLGEMPQEVSAHGGNYLHEDIADVTLSTMTFASGVRAHIFVSWLHPYKEQKLVIVGDKKMLLFDDIAPQDKLLLYCHKIDWIDRMPIPHQEEAESVEFTMEEPLRLECQHFLECIETRHKPRTDGNSGLRVLQILDACQKSLKQRGQIVSLSRTEFFLHESSIVEQPSRIGKGTKVWHFCHIMPNTTIGDNCVIGQNVFIGSGVEVGDNVKLENNVSVFEGVKLEDNVFCGPSCTFTNVVNPRSRVARQSEFKETLVKKGATIGANATIVCGNTIGEYAFIGAGAVVTKDVPDYALVYGNPARLYGWVCECGAKLAFSNSSQAQCSTCAKQYNRRETEGEQRVGRANS